MRTFFSQKNCKIIWVCKFFATLFFFVLPLKMEASFRQKFVEQKFRVALGNRLGGGVHGRIFALQHDNTKVVKIFGAHDDELGRQELVTSYIMGHHRIGPKVYYADHMGGRLFYMVMDRIDGDLQQLRRSNVYHRYKRQIDESILNLLKKMHSLGFVHGDLKADNIGYKLQGQGPPRIYIIDFGLTGFKGSSIVNNMNVVQGIAHIYRRHDIDIDKFFEAAVRSATQEVSRGGVKQTVPLLDIGRAVAEKGKNVRKRFPPGNKGLLPFMPFMPTGHSLPKPLPKQSKQWSSLNFDRYRLAMDGTHPTRTHPTGSPTARRRAPVQSPNRVNNRNRVIQAAAAGPRAQQVPRRTKIIRNSIKGLTKPAMTRIARRGGVRRISSMTFEEMRIILRGFLQAILRDAVEVMKHQRKKTLTPEHVMYSLNRHGMKLYY